MCRVISHSLFLQQKGLSVTESGPSPSRSVRKQKTAQGSDGDSGTQGTFSGISHPDRRFLDIVDLWSSVTLHQTDEHPVITVTQLR